MSNIFQIISFRAECQHDIIGLLFNLKHKYKGLWRVAIHNDNGKDHTHEIELHITAPLTVDKIHSIMQGISGGHIMSSTLRALPLKDNSLQMRKARGHRESINWTDNGLD